MQNHSVTQPIYINKRALELASLSVFNLEDIALIAATELQKLQSAQGNYVWASDSSNFKYAFFGRDTETVVENIATYPEYQEQCCRWLVSLARLQGEKTNTTTEEHLGALPHEIRALSMDGQNVDANAIELFLALRAKWSEDARADNLVYYGELDGPQRFIKACAALAKNGVTLANVTYEHKSGERRNLIDACYLAIEWIQDRRRESDLGLVELCPPKNPTTLTNQTLKDSAPAYIHTIDSKPTVANRFAARAPLEAQLLSYEALIAFAETIADNTDPAYATAIRQSAAELKKNILANFVLTIQKTDGLGQDIYLAAMVDRDPKTGQPRKLNTIMSDAAEGLNGVFFSGDNPSTITLRQSVCKIIVSKDFLTDGGIRCRGLRDHRLYSFAEYHGAMPNWIVVTHMIAKGLHRQGYTRMAREVWTRMLCGMIAAGQFQEFCYFDEQGRLLVPEDAKTGQAQWVLRGEENSQKNQAWSISAALEAVRIMSSPDHQNLSLAEQDFEDNLLATIPNYRDNPDLLIQKLRENMQVYRLEQVRQSGHANEVDINGIDKSKPILRPILID